MMMKKTGLLAVLTAGVLLLAGCGGEAKTIDAQALAKSLATEIKYDDTLKELTADEISMLVDLPEDVDSVMYAGSGSTAEEVGVFTAKDSNQAKETMEDVQKYLDDQADSLGLCAGRDKTDWKCGAGAEKSVCGSVCVRGFGSGKRNYRKGV